MLHQFSVEFEGNDMKIQRLVLLCAAFSLGFVIAEDDSDRWTSDISLYDSSEVDSEQEFGRGVDANDQSRFSGDDMSQDVGGGDDNDSDGRWNEESSAVQAMQREESELAYDMNTEMQQEENEANLLGEQAAEMMLGGDIDSGEYAGLIDDQAYSLAPQEVDEADNSDLVDESAE